MSDSPDTPQTPPTPPPTTPPTEPDESAGPPDRVSATLVTKAGLALVDVSQRLGVSRTDAVNRSIQAYAWLERQVAEGKELAIYDPATAQTQIVHML